MGRHVTPSPGRGHNEDDVDGDDRGSGRGMSNDGGDRAATATVVKFVLARPLTPEWDRMPTKK